MFYVTFFKFIKFLGAWHQLYIHLGHVTKPALNLKYNGHYNGGVAEIE